MKTSLEYQWMPFTNNRSFKEKPQFISKAKGLYYWNPEGHKMIDGSSGLFCCALGHGRKEISEAVYQQLNELDYTPQFQRGSPISFEVAERIAKLTPKDINRIFFVNDGSEAVDSAMKMVLAYHRANGQAERTLFVSRERAYHGVNFGGIALSGMVKNRDIFGFGLPNVVHMRHTWSPEQRFTKGQPETGADKAEDLQRMADLYGGQNIAACFVEPVAGSTGTLVPPKGYLERLREICDQHGILLVFDEVITGFGRTGQPFASQTFGVTPDIITMAKAMTNGTQPMGAIAVHQRIYDKIISAAKGDAPEFFHGYTFSGHPAACAAALTTMDIMDSESVFENVRNVSDYFLDSLMTLKDLPAVTDVRGIGLLAGIEFSMDEKPGQRGSKFQRAFYDSGLHVKTTGDAAVIAPPLIIDKAGIDEIVSILKQVIKKG